MKIFMYMLTYWSRRGWPVILVAVGVSAASFIAVSQVSPPAFKVVNLAADPLYNSSTVDKPTIVLQVGAEYPVTGALYGQNTTAEDSSYTNSNEYLGYFDSDGCYTYNDIPTGIPNGESAADYKRFVYSSAANSRMCTNAFSGNFLNWASASTIDMIRMALTGGDRWKDTENLTILQRSMVSDGIPIGANANNTKDAYSFLWNSPKFPAKKLLANSGNYFGAVPGTMIDSANNNNIWIGNILNRIYFHTAKSGANVGNTLSIPSGSHTSSYTLGGPSRGSLNSDGFFYARVQVCDKNAAGQAKDPRHWGLCVKQPADNYKPIGTLQRYADQARVAVFSYILDNTRSDDGTKYDSSATTGYTGRFAGALRAPMKYLGYKTFNKDGVENTPANGNAEKEWDPSNGVLVNNPFNPNGNGVSGVINYINRFGRTGNAGFYKVFDPVGDLHYEAIRYLQGKQPSSAAVSNINNYMSDGFPIYTSWGDPYGDGRLPTADYSCNKSTILVVGDTDTFDSNIFPAPSVANNIPDLAAWRTVVQNFEKNVSGNYVDGSGVNRNTSNSNPNPNNLVPSATWGSKILGSAYWARSHDIRGTTWTNSRYINNSWVVGNDGQRPGLRVKTMVFDVNQDGAQNDNATRRNRNQLFMAAKYGGYETDANNIYKNPFNLEGNPFKNSSGESDKYVWSDTNTLASRVDEANTYYRVGTDGSNNNTDARQILVAFDDMFARAATTAQGIGSALSSKSLTQAGATLYQSTFKTSDWSGDLMAYAVNVNGAVVSVGNTNIWSAQARLDALANPASSRHIYVGQAGSGSSQVAQEFTWANVSGTALATALNKPNAAASADSMAQDRLNYLRGDKSKEANSVPNAVVPFRNRSHILGDIINSGVVYSGAPSANLSASASYSAFYAANRDRTPAVFAGANDGMLHAFQASTGDELFAYIPSWVGSKLSLLTNTDYQQHHASFVDGLSVVGEAQLSDSWKTVLVSASGAGGKGVFALDVTNPTTFTQANALWEFTSADDADLGYVVGQPQIVKLRTSAAGATTATYGWFAVFGSGVNNYAVSEDGIFSSTGRPALFILNLSKPAGTAWALNSNYYKVSLPVDTALSVNTAPGLINFTPVLDSNGVVSQIYMGDLHGNLWKLNFTAYGSSDWNLSKLSAFSTGNDVNALPIPMYIAKDSALPTNNVQPISAAPRIYKGDKTGAAYVLFGTGKYLEADDKASTDLKQSQYMVYDNGSSTNDTTGAVASAITGRAFLKEVRVNPTTGVSSVDAFQLGRAMSAADAVRSGWYFDFPKSGERIVSETTLVGSKFLFSSLIPGGSSVSCATANGAPGGNRYYVDIATGVGKSAGSSVGILGQPMVLPILGSGAAVATGPDTIRRKTKTIMSQVVQLGGSGLDLGGVPDPNCPDNTPAGVVCTRVAAGRLSVRQISNYLELKNK